MEEPGKGMILSHNPLSVIDDASFFQLPAVSYLDLGATRVSRLTVLNLLLTAARLEMLRVPRAAACCLCQEGRAAETLCRRVRFQGRELCASSPHCGRLPAPHPAGVGSSVPPDLLPALGGAVLRLRCVSSLLHDPTGTERGLTTRLE
uniref:Uncharacterized protein n=1 Tax=Gallus gallus TaxID=9031 RepID=A0A8V0ZN86_CHICK